MSIQVEVCGDAFPQRSCTSDIYLPHFASFDDEGVIIKQLDTVESWKGISHQQAVELLFWEQAFQKSLESLIEEKLYADFTAVEHQSVNGILPEAESLRRMHQYVNSFGYKQFKFSLKLLVNFMLDYRDAYGRHCTWFHAAGDPYQLVTNLLRTKDCFRQDQEPRCTLDVQLSASLESLGFQSPHWRTSSPQRGWSSPPNGAGQQLRIVAEVISTPHRLSYSISADKKIRFLFEPPLLEHSRRQVPQTVHSATVGSPENGFTTVTVTRRFPLYVKFESVFRVVVKCGYTAATAGGLVGDRHDSTFRRMNIDDHSERCRDDGGAFNALIGSQRRSRFGRQYHTDQSDALRGSILLEEQVGHQPLSDRTLLHGPTERVDDPRNTQSPLGNMTNRPSGPRISPVSELDHMKDYVTHRGRTASCRPYRHCHTCWHCDRDHWHRARSRFRRNPSHPRFEQFPSRMHWDSAAAVPTLVDSGLVTPRHEDARSEWARASQTPEHSVDVTATSAIASYPPSLHRSVPSSRQRGEQSEDGPITHMQEMFELEPDWDKYGTLGLAPQLYTRPAPEPGLHEQSAAGSYDGSLNMTGSREANQDSVASIASPFPRLSNLPHGHYANVVTPSPSPRPRPTQGHCVDTPLLLRSGPVNNERVEAEQARIQANFDEFITKAEDKHGGKVVGAAQDPETKEFEAIFVGSPCSLATAETPVWKSDSATDEDVERAEGEPSGRND